MEEEALQSIAEHLQELRRRLFFFILIFSIGAFVAYIIRTPMLEWMSHPLGMPLFYNSPAGGLIFIFKICFIAGVVFALPVGVYNLIQFVKPAFKKKVRRRKILLVTFLSSLLAILGILFGYYVILPFSFRFFDQFNIGGIQPLISTNEYFSFIASCFLVFALIFQIPLLLFFFNSLRRFPPGSLRKYRRYVYVASFVIALILPFTYDPVTQFIMAVPIILLFEVSVFGIWLVNRKCYKSKKRFIKKPINLIEKNDRKKDKKGKIDKPAQEQLETPDKEASTLDKPIKRRIQMG